jgi:small-conductance mechanosensitive channel
MEYFNHLFSQMRSFSELELLRLEDTRVTIWTVVQLFVLSGLLLIIVPKLNASLLKYVQSRVPLNHDIRKHVVRLSRAVLFLVGFILVFHIAGVETWIFGQLSRLYHLVQSAVDLHLFKLGHTQVTLLEIVYLLSLSWLLVRVTSELRTFVVNRVLGRTNMDIGVRQTIGSLVHYGVLFVGFIVLLQTAGIDLSALTVLVGALGIGISFGLQTITNNFICGLIIMFERPIKLRDRIQVGDITGEVVDISLRATTIATKEGISVVVPNSQFVTANVINWTHAGRSVGFKFPATVSSKADPRSVQKTILDVVTKLHGVEKTPPPLVLLDEIAGDSMKFSVWVWTKEFLAFPDVLRSELNFEITNCLRDPETDVSLTAA